MTNIILQNILEELLLLGLDKNDIIRSLIELVQAELGWSPNDFYLWFDVEVEGD